MRIEHGSQIAIYGCLLSWQKTETFIMNTSKTTWNYILKANSKVKTIVLLQKN